jgi:hypothetical protein
VVHAIRRLERPGPAEPLDDERETPPRACWSHERPAAATGSVAPLGVPRFRRSEGKRARPSD